MDFFEALAAAIGDAGDDPEARAETISELEGEFGDIETSPANVETCVSEECAVDRRLTEASTPLPHLRRLSRAGEIPPEPVLGPEAAGRDHRRHGKGAAL